ncbi:hypothetical protein ACUXCC_004262 [Cytobacillus horneckiae]
MHENIDTTKGIGVGDKVKVYFDINNRIDGLLKVEVME